MKALNSIGPSHLRGSDRESARPRGLASRPTGPGVLPVWIVAILLTVPAAAQTTEFGNPYVIGAAMQSLTGPDGTNRLNCVLPENNGGYVAVWDVGNTAVVERRSPAGSQLWTWAPPEPLPVDNELTRVVLGGRDRVLWCSTMRWYFLGLTNGTPVSSGAWSLPYLDPGRIIVQNDNLHVLYGSNASVYDTNMVFQGTLTGVTLPEGYWKTAGGTWLIDLSTRTNYAIRLATLDAGLQIGTPFQIPLPPTTSGGYVDHRVLGADTNAILVVSSVHWPALVQTRHFFSTVDRSGTLRSRHSMDCNQIVTGSVPLATGWLLSAQFLGEIQPRQSLYVVDEFGRPHWQVLMPNTAPAQYRILNSHPPRVLRFADDTSLTIHPTTQVNWCEVINSLVWPSTSWDETVYPAPLSGTNHFWNTAIRLNNT
jgi:hypothetical protein